MKQKITVSDDEDTNYLALALEAKTDAARKYITDHAQEYTEFEGFVGVKQATIGAKFTEQNPLTTALPYRDAYYTIGYTDTPSKGLVITIHSFRDYQIIITATSIPKTKLSASIIRL